ncbi:hypothetical protein RAH32_05105 [Paracoccus sp. WLY502]|uniref:hypothetical protein n=1 Tax=Paracoccus yibinensis TaxID=3068891 RepID=UPI0027969EF2|nr:hypothetical protein [Paracoccus sp. WLY502]MDQ1899818.1 hypothetical protein [Paracoccus sp. WLY502]
MLEGKDCKNADKSWSDESENIRKEISSTEKMVGFKLSEYLRNEATNHYSFRAAKKNLTYTSPNADFSLYVHQKHGNSFYPAGEEVMFIARVSRHIHGLKNITFHEAIDAWMLWVREVVTIMSNHYYKMIVEHIFNQKPGKFAKKVTYYVPFSMVQEVRKPTAPIFMRDRGPSKCV